MKKVIFLSSSQSSKLRKDIPKCLSMIRKAWIEKKPITAWDMQGERLKSFELEVKEVSNRKERIVLVPSAESADWQSINEIVRGSGILNFYLPSESIVFRSELLSLEHDYLVIKYPTRWMFEERRKHERLEAIGNVQMFLPLDNQRVKTFKVFDLSRSGLSVILPKGEAHKFEKGQSFENTVIDLHGKKIRLSMEVMNILNLKPYELEKSPYASKKVGFKFSEEDKTVGDFIDTLKEDVQQKKQNL